MKLEIGNCTPSNVHFHVADRKWTRTYDNVSYTCSHAISSKRKNAGEKFPVIFAIELVVLSEAFISVA